ncbi:LOW QUALITY PROTEIN: uncharacterized protein LOC143286820 [Babylonia areolata]|uniref:LOW QUALITY PROTEIN: uncharacterized protein LOC143286820 n=1 Tax=Babylonia areolata TaxID=304850 RepID=UPI003FD43A2B
MADDSTEQKIIEYLKQCQERSATISDLFDAISVHKNLLRTHLRKLKRNKLVYENRQSTPPTWSLNHAQANIPLAPLTASDSDLNLKERIVKYFSQQKVPRTALEVAKSLGQRSKKVVNPILYRLEKDQVLVSDSTRGQKPLWHLFEKASTMAELFRDTSQDRDAPGAFSPDKSNRAAGLLSERQHYRLQHRSHGKPYDTADVGQRHRNLSGSVQRTASTHILPCQDPIKQSNSGIMTDSGDCDSVRFTGEGMTVTLSADGKDREVAVVSSDEKRSCHSLGDHTQDTVYEEFTNSTPMEKKQSYGGHTWEYTFPEQVKVDEDICTSDDDKSDDDDSGQEFEPREMTQRFQEMMGNLEFSEMTFVEEVDMADEDMIRPDAIVLLQLSLEPNQTASTHQLVQALHKTEEEILYVLESCGDMVSMSNGVWSLTDSGAAWVREKQNAFPSLVQQISTYNDSSTHAQRTLVYSSPKGLPLFPQQLIETDPTFYKQPHIGSDRSVGCESPFKPLAGRGRDIGGAGSARNKVGGCAEAGVGQTTSQPLQSLFTSPPTLVSTPLPTSSILVNSAANSTQQIHMSEQRAIGRATAITCVDLQQRRQTAEERSHRHSALQSLNHSDSQTPGQLKSQGQGSSMSSITPSLQRFAEEGLMVVAPSGARMMPVGPGFCSLPMVQSVDSLEQQMGSTDQAVNSLDEPVKRTGHQLSSSCGDIHRSQSQPVLSSEVTGGEGPGSLLKITSESFAALNKNPISALMEYAQSRRLQAVIEVVSQRGPSHRPVFLMAARVGSRQFPGVTCSNKKDGRKEAADVALRTLIAEGQYSAAAPTPSVNIAPEAMTHFDKIAALTHQTFNTLIATIPENLAGRKVIAGLVMKRSEDDVGVVISIGTGNRCITGDKLSLEGNTVNDSHAEIITRRGFMRFLYQQLEKYEHGQPHDLFEPCSSGQLKVKAGITFHLYISTAPCGDGALFSPRDMASNSAELADTEKREHHPTFTSNVQGLLRTKMEGGEGTIPVDNREVTMQTWDGVVRGERLRTMSCTDKICRWNVLGLQGALLSHFVEPVYLDSLTLGFLYDHGHLSRAVCCRLAKEDPPLTPELPSGYRLNHPWLGRVTACQPLRETQKTKAFSINWTIGDPKAEVLDGTLGHCYTGVEKCLFSRLAKRSLYDSFKVVAQRLGRHDLLEAPTYHNNKQAARPFQQAKAAMVRQFQRMGCGWVKKPVEEEMFS